MDQRQKEVCLRLKQFRESIQWPQAALAYEIGTTRDQLASIEYCRTPLRYDLGYRFCTIFNVNSEWLATGKGPASPSRFCHLVVAPGNLPPSLLFTEVFDSTNPAGGMSSVVIRSKSAAEKETRGYLNDQTSKLEDPTGFVISRTLKILHEQKFESRAMQDQFAYDVVRLVQNLALDYRRRRVANKVRRKPDLQLHDQNHGDLSKKSASTANKILKLKAQIDDLEAEVLRLESGED